MPGFEPAQEGTEQKVKGSEDGFCERTIALLPRLSAVAYCLTGNAKLRDRLVQDTCTRALAHQNQWEPGTHLDSWMFRIALNLWFDEKRAMKLGSANLDLEVPDFPVGSGEWAVTERKQGLTDLLMALAHLSPEHRVLIALVCVGGLTYTQAADILDLPLGTVMGRLAHGRLVLYDAAKAAIASSATRQ